MWPNPQKTADVVTFTEEILNGNFHFLCSDSVAVYPLYFRYNIWLTKNIFKRCYLQLDQWNIYHNGLAKIWNQEALFHQEHLQKTRILSTFSYHVCDWQKFQIYLAIYIAF